MPAVSGEPEEKVRRVETLTPPTPRYLRLLHRRLKKGKWQQVEGLVAESVHFYSFCPFGGPKADYVTGSASGRGHTTCPWCLERLKW